MKFVLKQKTRTLATQMLVLLGMIGLCHAQIVLRFQPQINTQANTLGDILLIENDEHNWAQVSLQSHPTSGTFITKNQIMQWMTKRFGAFDSLWQGKTRMQIDKAASQLAPAQNVRIRKGDLIHVKAHDHGITITMDAIALTQAKVDQIIEVQNPRSQQTFWVKITDAKQAEVIA